MRHLFGSPKIEAAAVRALGTPLRNGRGLAKSRWVTSQKSGMTIVFISLLLPFGGNYVDWRLRRKGHISLILRQYASCRLLRLPDHQIPDLAGPFATFDAVARLSGWLLYKLETLSRAGGPGGVRRFGQRRVRLPRIHPAHARICGFAAGQARIRSGCRRRLRSAAR